MLRMINHNKQGWGGGLTISGHAHGEALLEAAVLAAVAVHAHDQAVLVLHAHLVVDVLLNAAPEETLRKKRRESGILKRLCHNRAIDKSNDNIIIK